MELGLSFVVGMLTLRTPKAQNTLAICCVYGGGWCVGVFSFFCFHCLPSAFCYLYSEHQRRSDSCKLPMKWQVSLVVECEGVFFVILVKHQCWALYGCVSWILSFQCFFSSLKLLFWAHPVFLLPLPGYSFSSCSLCLVSVSFHNCPKGESVIAFSPVE